MIDGPHYTSVVIYVVVVPFIFRILDRYETSLGPKTCYCNSEKEKFKCMHFKCTCISGIHISLVIEQEL